MIERVIIIQLSNSISKKSENLKINVLSRRADHMTDKLQVNQTILQENSDNSIVYNRQNAATL